MFTDTSKSFFSFMAGRDNVSYVLLPYKNSLRSDIKVCVLPDKSLDFISVVKRTPKTGAHHYAIDGLHYTKPDWSTRFQVMIFTSVLNRKMVTSREASTPLELFLWRTNHCSPISRLS